MIKVSESFRNSLSRHLVILIKRDINSLFPFLHSTSIIHLRPKYISYPIFGLSIDGNLSNNT